MAIEDLEPAPQTDMTSNTKKSLMSLPSEIFMMIIAEVPRGVEIKEALKLQYTCKMFYTAISRAIALDHESTNESMDTAFRKCTYSCRYSCQYYHASPRIGGALLLEQMRQNPRHIILSPIYKALYIISMSCNESHEKKIQREQDVCAAFTERIRWANQRDSDGLRIFSLWAMMHNSAIAMFTTIEADDRETAQVHLSVAIIVRNITMIEDLLTSAVADVNLESRYFGRPLHLAARYGFVEVIHILLDHGAAVEAVQHGRFQDVSGRYPSLCKGGSALEAAAVCMALELSTSRSIPFASLDTTFERLEKFESLNTGSETREASEHLLG